MIKAQFNKFGTSAYLITDDSGEAIAVITDVIEGYSPKTHEVYEPDYLDITAKVLNSITDHYVSKKNIGTIDTEIEIGDGYLRLSFEATTISEDGENELRTYGIESISLY